MNNIALRAAKADHEAKRNDAHAVTHKAGKLFIIRKVTRKADGSPRKRPVFERDGKIYKTLTAARKG